MSNDSEKATNVGAREWWIAFGGDPSNDEESYKRYTGAWPYKGARIPGEDVVRVVEHSAFVALQAENKKLTSFSARVAVPALEKQRDELRAEVSRVYLLLLAFISGYIPTPEEGYLKAPYLIEGDLVRVGAQHSALKEEVKRQEKGRLIALQALHDSGEREDKLRAHIANLKGDHFYKEHLAACHRADIAERELSAIEQRVQRLMEEAETEVRALTKAKSIGQLTKHGEGQLAIYRSIVRAFNQPSEKGDL